MPDQISTDMNDSSFIKGKPKQQDPSSKKEVDSLKEQITNLESNLKDIF